MISFTNTKQGSDALIELSNVYYHSSTSGKILLDNITMNVKPATITTIIGPNGAGKSTLLRLILGLISPTSGKIWSKKDIKIGYMPQKLVVNENLPLTVERFLTLSMKHKFLKQSFMSRGKIEEVLETISAISLYNQSIHTLSGGEWQRILLARALLQSPELLVLDEPVQGLDHGGQIRFYELLRHISSNLICSVIHVSHDLNLVWEASDIIICLNKHICCNGRPEIVMKDPEMLNLFGGFIPYIHHHDHSHDLNPNNQHAHDSCH